MVEHPAYIRTVLGSNPGAPTRIRFRGFSEAISWAARRAA